MVAYSAHEVDLFWSRVDRSGDPASCWDWMGRRTPNSGAGQLTFGPRQQLAHRVAYLLTRGPIPAGMVVLHDCGNAACCNPAHLRLGTTADVMARRRKPSKAATTE